MDIKKAVILAGGFGTRLKEITEQLGIPKPMIPIHGKPVLEHLVDFFKKFEINDIIFSIHYLPEKIKDYFGDGHKFNIKADYIMENEPLGTAGCLKLLKDKLTETFAMTNGDELKDFDLKEMLEVHRKNNALATIALWNVEDPSAYGVAKLDGDKILEFVEKPKKEEAPSNFINSGFYIIEPEVIDMVPEGFAMMEKDIFPKLAKMGKLCGYPFAGQWFDTGTEERYTKAQKEWKDLK
jgi:mannose-1-phosphate guanylyltransferase